MPQLDKSTFLMQILWLVIFLGILYCLIILIVLPTIHKGIALRKLILTNIIQKGYIFSNQIMKKAKYNDMFNYMLNWLNSLMFINLAILNKLNSFIGNLFESFIIINNIVLKMK